MITKKELRAEHTKLLKESIYSDYYFTNEQDFNHLSTLLDDVKGTLILAAIEESSWFSHIIKCNYKGYDFTLANDPYTHKLEVRLPAIYGYSITQRGNDIEVVDSKGDLIKKPLNYSFNKLTTKKLLSVMNYEIAKYNAYKSATEDKEAVNRTKYDEAYDNIKFIAQVFGTELKTSNNNNNETAYCYANHSLCEVSYDKQSKFTNVSREVNDMLENIKTIKNYFTQG